MHNQDITKYKNDKLVALDIDWFVYIKPGWDDFFEELVEFQKKYGHCRVKQGNKEYASLANWVSIQRQNQDLTQVQKDKLNSIGFVWSIKPRIINRPHKRLDSNPF